MYGQPFRTETHWWRICYEPDASPFCENSACQDIFCSLPGWCSTLNYPALQYTLTTCSGI